MSDSNKSNKKLVTGFIILAVSGLLVGGCAGYFGSKAFFKQYVLKQMIKEGYIDTSDATATAEDIAEGKTAYINGEEVTGETEIFDTSDATATSDTILKGKTAYVDGQLVVGTISMVAEDKITPGSDPTIISGDIYLMGDIIVKGDSNFVRSNIRAGVRIFNVTGTYNPALQQAQGDEEE